MIDESTVKSRSNAPQKSNSADENELERLKSILLKQEREKLQYLLDHLNNPKLHSDDLARDLPEAIVLSNNKSNKLKAALTPLTENIIKTSFKKNIKTFADALYPVIGPAIRKAISESLKSLIQSINKTLDYSFSIQGIKWRIESIRTGRPFAEIVLSHTLIYQVEQVFLIHKKSGVLLQHIVNSTSVIQDPDIVSGMLNAIQSFVNDSFTEKQNGTLNLLEVGDLTVWIEQSPDLILAAVVRGIAPNEIRAVFQNILEDIQVLKSAQLADFNGEISSFEDTKDLLKECLLTQAKQSKHNKKKFKKFWLAALLLIGIIIILTTFILQKDSNWQNFLSELNNTPGVVITSVEKTNGHYYISGLRDPLSVNPNILLKNNRLDSTNVIFNFKPYISLESEILLKRIKKLCNPPSSVTFKITNGTILLSGSAHHLWIDSLNNRLKALYFPIQYNNAHLIDIEKEDFKQISRNIYNQYISFDKNISNIPKNEKKKLTMLAAEIEHLQKLAKLLNINFYIKLIAHSDQIGPVSTNRMISKMRINNVEKELQSQGLKKELFKEEIKDPDINITHKNKRCVHFSVIAMPNTSL